MKILITGGLGHIGSYLIHNLDHDITIIDNMSTQRYCSLFGFKGKFINGSFIDINVDDLAKFDMVIHLAAITDAANSFNNKDRLFDVNVDKTSIFILRCSLANVPMIFPSSTSVYGKGKELMKEDGDNVLPQSPYAESKIAIENYLLKQTMDQYKYLIFRCGTIYGSSPGMRFHTAINTFCFNAMYDIPIKVWRDNIYMERPYLGLADLKTAIEMGLDNKLDWRETYNVVSENVHLYKILNYIKDKKSDVIVDYVDSPLLNQQSYIVDNSKIKSKGMIFKTTVKEGIEKTFNRLENR